MEIIHFEWRHSSAMFRLACTNFSMAMRVMESSYYISLTHISARTLEKHISQKISLKHRRLCEVMANSLSDFTWDQASYTYLYSINPELQFDTRPRRPSDQTGDCFPRETFGSQKNALMGDAGPTQRFPEAHRLKNSDRDSFEVENLYGPDPYNLSVSRTWVTKKSVHRADPPYHTKTMQEQFETQACGNLPNNTIDEMMGYETDIFSNAIPFDLASHAFDFTDESICYTASVHQYSSNTAIFNYPDPLQAPVPQIPTTHHPGPHLNCNSTKPSYGSTQRRLAPKIGPSGVSTIGHPDGIDSSHVSTSQQLAPDMDNSNANYFDAFPSPFNPPRQPTPVNSNSDPEDVFALFTTIPETYGEDPDVNDEPEDDETGSFHAPTTPRTTTEPISTPSKRRVGVNDSRPLQARTKPRKHVSQDPSRTDPAIRYYCIHPECAMSLQNNVDGFSVLCDMERHLALHLPKQFTCTLPHRGKATREFRRKDQLRT